MNSTLHGLIAAPHTPFAANGDLDIEVIPRQAALLAHNGVSGAFVCGTTGEGCSMTIAERRQVVERWRSATPAGLKLVVHVGHLSLSDSIELARHAAQTGADAIATIAPSFFKPAGTAELVAWCERIAAAAPKLPFYYYHMPSMTGVTISATDFLNQANGCIPNLAGVKFTHEDLTDFGHATNVADGRFAMLFGRDEILLDGLPLGAKGAVGSTYNFAAPLYTRIIRSFEAGDLEAAKQDQKRAWDFIAVLGKFGGLSAGKAVMKLIGVDCGPVRLPLRALTPADEAGLRSGLERVGFFDYCCKLP
ncbi:MAG TPA: dihydrodipicolinate synthase family protein [Opitutaceae bacterium]